MALPPTTIPKLSLIRGSTALTQPLDSMHMHLEAYDES